MATSATPAPRGSTGLRADLQGLRGVAVLGVVVYHLRPSWLPGGFAGVDVFFVLSGFFITGLLLREAEHRRRIDLVAFWGRRARRLLPASTVVLLATVLASRLVPNALEAQRTARDGVFASLFAMNWHEAAGGVAYGQDPNPSPFQHYWSLGVEEQFYLGWPVLVLALTLLWRGRILGPPRRTLRLVAAAALALSFALALQQTGVEQPYAYYGTFDRIWQLAVGGLLATAVAHFDAWPGPVSALCRLAGLGLVLGFYVAAPSVGVYPGWWSILPTSGAALIVLGGAHRSARDPVARLLGSRAGQLTGRYSYSWYLWHWPPLVLLPIALDRPLRVGELILCAAGTLLLGVLTFHLLEDPVRRSRRLTARGWGRSMQLGAVATLVALVTSQYSAVAAGRAAARAGVRTAAGQALVPQPLQAVAELPQVSRDGCQLPMTDAALAPPCRYLPDVGRGDVVLVGDSHAGMWFPAVDQVARARHWGLRVWARTSCPLADVHKTVAAGGEYRACDRWRADVIARLIAHPPSLVVVTDYVQSDLHVDDPVTGRGATQVRAHALFEAGYERSLRELRAAGLHVLVIADVPGFTQAGPDCALTHLTDLAACSLAERAAIVDHGVDAAAARAVPGVHLVDFTDAFCSHERCHQIVGNILAYRDVNHLTTPMVLHLVPRLRAAMTAAQAGCPGAGVDRAAAPTGAHPVTVVGCR